MSVATQDDFERLVVMCHQRHKATLRLNDPAFKRDGFIITATMSGTDGGVELRCGPAEYHVELFVSTGEKGGKRWSLADLLKINEVRTWMIENRQNPAGRSRLETEVDVAFSLFAVGLKGIPQFAWLFASA